MGSLPGGSLPAGSTSSVRAEVATRLRAAGCVFTEDEARLLVGEAGSPEELARLVEERASGVPLEHVLGWAEFCGRRVGVEPAVFVPRRRTELLARKAVAWAEAMLRRTDRPVVAVDLCCGSGAVAAALASSCGPLDLHAVDLDPVAVRCAQRNLAAVGCGQAYAGDLYDALPVSLRGEVDVLVANAPYVPTDAVGLMPPEARLYELPMALDGGVDGLDVLRRVVAEAPQWLGPPGCLLMESSESQAPALMESVAAAGLHARLVSSAERGATVVVGTRTADFGPCLQAEPGVADACGLGVADACGLGVADACGPGPLWPTAT